MQHSEKKKEDDLILHKNSNKFNNFTPIGIPYTNQII